MRQVLGIVLIVAGIAAFFVFNSQNEGFLGELMAELLGETSQSQSDGAQHDTVRGAARVIDGDTLKIGAERIRLHGIDAPEQAQTCTTPSGKRWRCGQVATAQLIEHLTGRIVSCSSGERDRYGRLIARCQVAGGDIGAWMVQNGWAFAYRRYSDDYSFAEDAARKHGLGIWTSSVQPPWNWRQQKQ